MLSGELTTPARTARWWFTNRDGGSSAPPYDRRNLAAHVGDDVAVVRRNRDALEHEIGLGTLTWMAPVHGVDLEIIDQPVSLVPNVDALATERSSRPLATLAADCVPLLMVADRYAIAAHIGWRGFVAGMTTSIIGLLADLQVDPAGATVLLGPAICGACYGIPDDRADAVAAVSSAAVVRARTGGRGADIRIGLADQWRSVGAHVQLIGPCTFEDRHYFSHRRDGVTGRQAGVIAWM